MEKDFNDGKRYKRPTLMHGNKAKNPKKRRCISRETRERLDGELKSGDLGPHASFILFILAL